MYCEVVYIEESWPQYFTESSQVYVVSKILPGFNADTTK